MVEVRTKEQLVIAITTGKEHILCKEDLTTRLMMEHGLDSKMVRQNNRTKRRWLLAGILCIASLAAVPFTAGTSLGMGAVIGGSAFAGVTAITGLGAVATGLAMETLTMSSKELLTICGAIVTAKALDKLYEIHFNNGDFQIDAIPPAK